MAKYRVTDNEVKKALAIDSYAGTAKLLRFVYFKFIMLAYTYELGILSKVKGTLDRNIIK